MKMESEEAHLPLAVVWREFAVAASGRPVRSAAALPSSVEELFQTVSRPAGEDLETRLTVILEDGIRQVGQNLQTVRMVIGSFFLLLVPFLALNAVARSIHDSSRTLVRSLEEMRVDPPLATQLVNLLLEFLSSGIALLISLIVGATLIFGLHALAKAYVRRVQRRESRHRLLGACLDTGCGLETALTVSAALAGEPWQEAGGANLVVGLPLWAIPSPKILARIGQCRRLEHFITRVVSEREGISSRNMRFLFTTIGGIQLAVLLGFMLIGGMIVLGLFMPMLKLINSQ
jgi:hypothetical protein